jgi:hypothetical protein
MGLEDRIRRLEASRASRSARARSTSPTADLERHAALVEYVRDHGREVPLPEHLVHWDREEEIATLGWLRSSGSGWDTDPEAIALLEAWERDLRA